MFTHEEMTALRQRGVRIESVFVPGLAAIDGRHHLAYGQFIEDIEPNDRIARQLGLDVAWNTGDDNIVFQIEQKAVKGELPGIIVVLTYPSGTVEMTTPFYVTANLFEEIVDFLEQKTPKGDSTFFAEHVQ